MVASPRLSVLLPVFNGGALLLRAVRSVLTQSFGDFELIVIDDGSTDGAVAEVLRLGDPRVRVLGGGTRLGLAARLNEGIDAATAPLIARMDADDIAFPDRFAKQVAFLEKNPEVDLLACRALAFREDEGVLDLIGLLPFAADHEAICARPWRGFPMPHPTWMGRAAWFRRYRYAVPETRRAEDQELLLRSHRASRFACLPDVGLAYRQTGFDLRKILTARRSLLAAQLRFFVRAGDGRQAALALLAGGVKIAVDLLAGLPGGTPLYFARMKGFVPAEAAAAFDKVRRALS